MVQALTNTRSCSTGLSSICYFLTATFQSSSSPGANVVLVIPLTKCSNLNCSMVMTSAASLSVQDSSHRMHVLSGKVAWNVSPALPHGIYSVTTFVATLVLRQFGHSTLFSLPVVLSRGNRTHVGVNGLTEW